MRVAAFSAGRSDPAARFRVRQYLNDLRGHGVLVDERYSGSGGAYPPAATIERFPWMLSQLRQRLDQVRSSRHHDLTLLQRQMVSTINTWEWLTVRPRILDVDDAIWLTSRFGSADRLARRCDGIICGNEWLAEHFAKQNKSIHVVPTAVDTRVWVPLAQNEAPRRRAIGWIGTSGNLKYLYGIERALWGVIKNTPDVDVLVICDRPPSFHHLPADRVVYRSWRESNEVADIQGMTVGLMPLEDSPWAWGKCSFKMLQYMACAVPAVASPVGMNKQVAALGGALLATSEAEWVDALRTLLTDEPLRHRLGAQGRATVEAHYSTPVIAGQLAKIYRSYI